MGAAEFFNVARRQVPTVRKRRTEGNAKRPGGRPGSGSVRSTTLDPLAEQNRCQVLMLAENAYLTGQTVNPNGGWYMN
jgi:hypothetical protein